MSSSPNNLLCVPLKSVKSINDVDSDGVILVSHCSKQVAEVSALKNLASSIAAYLEINEGAENSASLIAVDKSLVQSGRLIYVGTGPVLRDQDDVRSFSLAAREGMKLALKAGMKSPVLATVPCKKHPQAELVSALGAIQELYVPLCVRNEKKSKLHSLRLLGISNDSSSLTKLVEAFDSSFTVCRDIGDSDPQLMAPPRVAEYVENVFKGSSSVKVSVTADMEEIAREYPLMSAVNRAANDVEAHRARLIWLEYIPSGKVEQTIMLVGKGVTIDTGGADIKTGGHMLGMSSDKYGSAIVAGFFKALDILKPKGLKVVGYMCMVRNSIGANSYTCDEVITARSGKRIHIYFTDSEGRITMLDPLTKMLELAENEKNPHIFTLATLTGHEWLSYGYYASFMDNGPACAIESAQKIQKIADIYGQPIEISRLHIEDYEFHAAESEAADLRQGNNKPSVQTMRGHQSPAAFLIQASRLDEHGTDSKTPIKYTHIDMGGAMGDFPKVTYPNPLVALIASLILTKSK